MTSLTDGLRILQPCAGVFAYFDGRIAGRRLLAAPNWRDDGAYVLGVASYAVVAGAAALVYDTQISPEHARAIRAHLTGIGVRDIRVVLSHWHNDHVAGAAVFADCEIIAQGLTHRRLVAHQAAAARLVPPIDPLVLPGTLFDGRLDLTLGGRRVELHGFDIHSADGTVLWLPEQGLLLAGDTLEDPVSYIAEPAQLGTHIAELDRMAGWPIRRILPDHGDPARIAGGGYDPGLIAANRDYLERLRDPARRAPWRGRPLRDFLAAAPHPAISYFEPYEAVHAANIKALDAL